MGIHVLMNHTAIDESWIKNVLKRYIQPSDVVCILPFGFFEDTKNEADYNLQYSKENGSFYRALNDVFYAYGIKEIRWVNYFRDSKQEMIDKITKSTILLLPGGAPDLFMKRLKEKRIKKYVRDYPGLVIGESAGAMIQLDTYHITPDEDYSEFGVLTGLGQLSGFDIEVHYRNSKVQRESMEKIDKPVYGITDKGAILVEDKKVTCIGEIEILK